MTKEDHRGAAGQAWPQSSRSWPASEHEKQHPKHVQTCGNRYPASPEDLWFLVETCYVQLSRVANDQLHAYLANGSESVSAQQRRGSRKWRNVAGWVVRPSPGSNDGPYTEGLAAALHLAWLKAVGRSFVSGGLLCKHPSWQAGLSLEAAPMSWVGTCRNRWLTFGQWMTRAETLPCGQAW